MSIKTLADWQQSGIGFDAFIGGINIKVDADLFDYFVGCVPPAYYDHGLMLAGEPVSHIHGYPAYSVFVYAEDGSFSYQGTGTLSDALESRTLLIQRHNAIYL
jgi:hypothetical protein